MSNLYAMMVARHLARPDIKAAGMFNMVQFDVYTSAHVCFTGL